MTIIMMPHITGGGTLGVTKEPDSSMYEGMEAGSSFAFVYNDDSGSSPSWWVEIWTVDERGAAHMHRSFWGCAFTKWGARLIGRRYLRALTKNSPGEIIK